MLQLNHVLFGLIFVQEEPILTGNKVAKDRDYVNENRAEMDPVPCSGSWCNESSKSRRLLDGSDAKPDWLLFLSEDGFLVDMLVFCPH